MTRAAVIATPAQYDARSQARRSMIGKVKIAQKQLGMVDDDYRQLLHRTTGRMSAADCTLPELERMIDALKDKGFKPLPGVRKDGGRKDGAKAKPADHPVARKARALWISLYHLGAIHNPAEKALEHFAKRQLGERLQWMNQAHGYRLIEALKSIAERHGWSMGPVALNGYATQAPTVRDLQDRLCQTLLAKLKARNIAPAHWSLPVAAWSLAGEKPENEMAGFSAAELSRVAAKLGAILRESLTGIPTKNGDWI